MSGGKLWQDPIPNQNDRTNGDVILAQQKLPSNSNYDILNAIKEQKNRPNRRVKAHNG